ncbi:hypothetical protein AAFF_G00273940 [Aldrovandia affinis]|uniref:Uncharacterized protein n=1 Tax=Aldrovandia affinis TaxID=143900 RepID=A0AAD7SRK0_9TELE|nr:hypothetical protein AAFF_G00273940 [Aldrovandia affinis]
MLEGEMTASEELHFPQSFEGDPVKQESSVRVDKGFSGTAAILSQCCTNHRGFILCCGRFAAPDSGSGMSVCGFNHNPPAI